jgi:hypothetical protein
MIVGSFGFVPAPAKVRLTQNAGQLQILEKSKAEDFPSLPSKHTFKIRKKVTYLFPPIPIRPLGSLDEPKQIRSVLVPNSFSYYVVQQPESEPYYVSSKRELVTEFRMVKQYNNIGLLAHNNLAGSKFKNLTLGQKIYVIHENGQMDRYTVSAIRRFKALESTQTGSQFVDLDTSQTYSASEVFYQMYTGEPHLTFQTCIEAEGDASWGRLFVIATPDTEFE